MKAKEFYKSTTEKIKLLPKWTKVGVVGVVLMYVGLAGLTSAAIPWWIGKGDSALHLDYALSVYKQDIPRYREFVQYPIFHQLDKGYKTQIQRAAANPPLFYVMHAPIVGPLLESGRWKPAIALGRAFNVFLGVLAVIAMSWAGWLFGGKRKQLFAVAVPAVATLSFHFTNLNQNYALDVLLVLLGVLTTITWYKLLEYGLERRYLFSLLALSVLGMSTKATYIIFLGLSLLTVLIVAYIHGQGSKTQRLVKGSIISAIILASVLVAIGWFYYYWNYKTSGKWYTGELPGDFSSRKIKSLSMVLTSSGLWGNFYERFTSYEVVSKAIMYVSALGIGVGVYRTRLRSLRKDRTLFIGTGLLVLLLLGTFATQISHSVGIGNYSFRYFLPALLVFGLFISYGLLEFKKLKGQLLSLALLAMIVTSVFTTAKLDNIKAMVPEVGLTSNIYHKLDIAVTSNGFPEALLVLLLLFIVAGFVATAVALFDLSGLNTKIVKNK